MIDGLDEQCPVCGRTAGDHTLREWSGCMGTTTTDLPFEATPDDIARFAGASVRERFGLSDDVIVADHVVVRALTLAGDYGSLGVTLPGLLHEFQVGVPGGAPVDVARVMFIADSGGMRKYGRLARDSANGAANAAQKAGDSP